MSAPTSAAADLLVVGGGLGGVAAAPAALDRGRTVLLTEETDRIGGQLTSQGVPPDEHAWIEQFGATRTYRALRDAIREHYRTWYPLTEEARRRRYLDPGEGRVSALCHEPRVAAAVLAAMVAPYVAAGRLRILYRHRPVAAAVDGDRVRAVVVEGPDGTRAEVSAPFVLDATELGDLLPLTGTEHVTGFESRRDTGEPSAPDRARRATMQAFSWVFAVDHRAGEDHTVDRPAGYRHWAAYHPPKWPNRLLSLSAPDPRTLETVARAFPPNAGSGAVVADQSKDAGDKELWEFRRVFSRRLFRPGFAASDVTIVNWPVIDYLPGPLIGVADEERDRHLAAGARELSMSMLYRLRTEAPRPDGGTGRPCLRLRGDVLGTADGPAKAPYIRESRRIVARRRIVEQGLSLAVRGEHGAVRHPDSDGIGMYRIDLHPSTGGDTCIDVAGSPFRIPLGALLPVRVRNLLPVCKNIGTTHITNGCHRLHPVEWNIGEAAVSLAAHCLDNRLDPEQVYEDTERLHRFQDELTRAGVELAWPEVKGY
ncbi:FAD-dependent oxidoreductase [Streptomyces fuscichromogenes]|uniref:FAD-dependent oxidoreductase n=1 Tax=Streptomyces fuscichromogenes TaxID=1324013 RepID=A0A917XD22_9ACTN|nr:FAD-dependent oxidoreductase [Streptomyces fuscichromogenes]GGN10487.1 FAD-dependent oxidoreductase [Streptomyces fuscichromogenes]